MHAKAEWCRVSRSSVAEMSVRAVDERPKDVSLIIVRDCRYLFLLLFVIVI